MLFDPKWEVKTEPLSLAALIAWLETKPADERYCYGDHGHCLAAQYCQHIGHEYSVRMTPFPPSQDTSFDYALEWIALQAPRTFGAALERAKRLCK